jgi:biotin synthase-like enzyme
VNEWVKTPIVFYHNNRKCYSIPFTFQLPQIKKVIQYDNSYPLVGGTAVKLLPEYLKEIAEVSNENIPGVLQRFNPLATKTTLGCPNNCGFCAVNTIEKEYIELDDWLNLPIICDNNLLAASKVHFDKVVDKAKHIKQVDFNQGLDVRLLTKYHARRLAELDLKTIRLAWDSSSIEKQLLRGLELLRTEGIKDISCYVLIGYNDSPEDALYRLDTLYNKLDVTPFPMRYIPINSLTKKYTSPNWSEKELAKMQRYWSRLNWTKHIPYKEFING